MSASNWAICPKCLSAANVAAEKEQAEVADQYGKVPVEEFDRLRAALKPVDPEKFRTFREDYEFYGAERGEIVASYGGGCGTCGLKAAFRAVRPFWPDDQPVRVEVIR